MLIKENFGWYGRGNFAGKLLDSVHLIPMKDSSKSFPVIKYFYVAYLKVAMWFVFALYGLFIFMVSWVLAYSESF